MRILMKQNKEFKAENAKLQEIVCENLWQTSKLPQLLQRIGLLDVHMQVW